MEIVSRVAGSLPVCERAIQDAQFFAEICSGPQDCWKNEIIEGMEKYMLRPVLVECSFGRAACDRSAACASVSGI